MYYDQCALTLLEVNETIMGNFDRTISAARIISRASPVTANAGLRETTA